MLRHSFKNSRLGRMIKKPYDNVCADSRLLKQTNHIFVQHDHSYPVGFANESDMDRLILKQIQAVKFDANGLNVDFAKSLKATFEKKPNVCAGYKTVGLKENTYYSSSNAGVNVTCRNTGPSPLKIATEIAVIPPICDAKRYVRHEVEKGKTANSDEFRCFPLQTVDRKEYNLHINSLFDYLKIMKFVWDLMSDKITGGYNRHPGMGPDAPVETTITGEDLARSKVAFQYHINKYAATHMKKNEIYQDVANAVSSYRQKSNLDTNDYDITKALLDVYDTWVMDITNYGQMFTPKSFYKQVQGLFEIVKMIADGNTAKLKEGLEVYLQDTGKDFFLASKDPTFTATLGISPMIGADDDKMSKILEQMNKVYSALRKVCTHFENFSLPCVGNVAELHTEAIGNQNCVKPTGEMYMYLI